MIPKISVIETAASLGVTKQHLFKQIKQQGLPVEIIGTRSYISHSTARKLYNYKFKSQVVAIEIVKGGTGKTTIASSIAVRANLYGARVLLIDLDQQGNLTQDFGIDVDGPVMVDVLTKNDISFEDGIVNICEGLDIFPSVLDNAQLDNVLIINAFPLHQVYREFIQPLKKQYDLILIDCPPDIGHSVVATSLAADLILMPVTPEQHSLSGLSITTQELLRLQSKYKRKIDYKVLINKYDNRTALSKEVVMSILEHDSFKNNLFDTYIRSSQEFPNSTAKHISIFDNPKNTSAKEDINSFTRELLGIEQKHNKDYARTLGSLKTKIILDEAAKLGVSIREIEEPKIKSNAKKKTKKSSAKAY